MAKLTLPQFGQLDSDQLEDYYEASVPFGKDHVSADLNFDESSIDIVHLEAAGRFLTQLADYDFKIKKLLQEDYQDEDADTVRTYLEHHLDELPEDELDELLTGTDKKRSREEQLFSRLHLVRVGFYPHQEDQFAVFDYSIGEDITQYLIAVILNESGVLNYMTMES